MSTSNPIDLLYGGLEKLGPGSDTETVTMLRRIPKRQFDVVVDAGCGNGRQTLVLAKELGTVIHAVDSYAPFLSSLTDRATAAGIGPLVETHCMDMKDIPAVFPNVDLLWSEGAAYNIGFANALATWSSAITKGGFVAVSELSWLRDEVPASVKEFFAAAYPDMRSITQNIAVAESAGYRVLTTHTVPEDTWTDGYYDVLERRAETLIGHPDSAVRDLATETLREIEVFRVSAESYGYVFYILCRA